MASIRRDDDGPVYLVAKASAVTSASCISCFGEEVSSSRRRRRRRRKASSHFLFVCRQLGLRRPIFRRKRRRKSACCGHFLFSRRRRRSLALCRPIRCAHSWPRRNAVIAGHDRRRHQQRLQISRPSFLCFFRNIVSASSERVIGVVGH